MTEPVEGAADPGGVATDAESGGDGAGAERAFVLGLDGVPWGMLREWAEAGELPNVARLLEGGAAGPLESTTPATTPLAWPSIATGVSPDKHGIYGWQVLSPEYSHRMYTGADTSGPFLWDCLTPAVVGNVPMTYPARDVDGSMVAGLMTPEAGVDGFASPPDLADEIAAEIPDYQVGLYWEDYDGATPAFLDDLQSLLENRRRLMKLLVDREPWTLFFFVYTAPDRLQHLCWDEDVLLEHYKFLDEIVGDAMAHADERDATLYVVSDHGFGPVHSYVAPNRALADAGFLQRRGGSGTRSTFEGLGITRDSVLGALERVGVDEQTLLSHLPRSLVDSVATHIPGDDVLYDVDFERTQAFVHGPGNVYVNDTERFASGVVAPEDVPDVKEAVAELLGSITDPETGEPVLEVVDGDELFLADPESPDLAIEAHDGYEAITGWTDRSILDDATMAAGHRMDGVFLAWGPSIRVGATPTDASVYDVAPTLLHDLGEPIPDRVDGRVLTEVFAPGSDPARRAVAIGSSATDGASASADGDGVGGEGGSRTGEAESGSDEGAAAADDMDAVEDRLRGLGYME
jgi:predicted AlkP superfamily phosphohydrolase/phosphomutase